MINLQSQITLSTKYGEFQSYYVGDDRRIEGVVLVKKPWPEPMFLRIQSSCVFSESFGADDCDCALQLEASLKELSARGGIVIYLYEEGRGLGLEGKFRAVHYQQMKGCKHCRCVQVTWTRCRPKKLWNCYGYIERTWSTQIITVCDK
jgi:GTP cyclohydrolase II